MSARSERSHASVLSSEVGVALISRSMEPASTDPTESQRGCPSVPRAALSTSILNTECPPVPRLAPRSDGLEMRLVG